ncbi:MAG: PorT family protein [Cytophagales bacterium]|nr:PorT family protein [Cytophagales bacterium]MDW8383654.1 outer membrane beta-barrel protein [Flammeovirgaceae bacterium]
MKYCIFGFCVIVWTINKVEAQIPDSLMPYAGKTTFGMKAGYTLSTLYGKEIEYIFAENTAQPVGRWHAGICFTSRLTPRFWLMHELLFSQRGSRVSFLNKNAEKYSSFFRTSYLDFYPANLVFNFRGLQLYSGIYTSLLLHATAERQDDNNHLYKESFFGSGGENEQNQKYLQKFDFGANIGLKYEFPFRLSLEIRYAHGIVDIFQYANSYTFEDNKNSAIQIFHRFIMISAGYTFTKK